MSSVVADTHAIVWYLMKSPRLSAPALTCLRECVASGQVIIVPSICLVEIIYLTEKGRLSDTAGTTLANHLDRPDADLRVAVLDRGVAEALESVPRDEVADMPDRIIAATALHLRLPLVSRDRKIRATDLETVW